MMVHAAKKKDEKKYERRGLNNWNSELFLHVSEKKIKRMSIRGESKINE